MPGEGCPESKGYQAAKADQPGKSCQVLASVEASESGLGVLAEIG
jgi:hypothetical protein